MGTFRWVQTNGYAPIAGPSGEEALPEMQVVRPWRGQLAFAVSWPANQQSCSQLIEWVLFAAVLLLAIATSA